jgi:hypothetical protein
VFAGVKVLLTELPADVDSVLKVSGRVMLAVPHADVGVCETLASGEAASLR